MSARIEIDRSRRLDEGAPGGHNRWHPGIPPVLAVDPGEVVTFELRDSRDGTITRTSSHEDLLAIPALAHPLTGPLEVRGAEPGDVLEIDVLGYETDDFAWTAIWPGSGFLGDLFERPFLARWELDGERARSEDVPGVAVPAGVFAGVIGVAPSAELFTRALAREADLASRGGDFELPSPELAVPPSAADGLRTYPPRENGGNIDIRDLVAGSRLLLPVHAPGALLSIGDLHFAQGDGEVCISAIETGGTATVRVGPAPRGLAPPLPGLGEPTAGRAQVLCDHRHPARRPRPQRAARPQPGHPAGAARDARLARARARDGARAGLRADERRRGAPRVRAGGQAERARVGGAAARRVRALHLGLGLDFKCT